LITISLLLLAAGYYLFSFRPNQRELAALADDLDIRREALAELETLPAQLQRARSELREIGTFVGPFEEQASPRPSAAVFERVSQAIVGNGCRTTRFDPQPAEDYATLHRLRLNVEFEGDCSQVFAALAALEAGGQPTWLDTLRLTPGQTPQSDVHCQAALSIFSAKPSQPD
jgi:Tfp pilus assembly protein PilO